MGVIIVFGITFYLIIGAVIGGIVDDSRNESITDGWLNNKNLGVPLCVSLWPVLVVLIFAITILNAAYLLGKKVKRKWWNK